MDYYGSHFGGEEIANINQLQQRPLTTKPHILYFI